MIRANGYRGYWGLNANFKVFRKFSDMGQAKLR